MPVQYPAKSPVTAVALPLKNVGFARREGRWVWVSSMPVLTGRYCRSCEFEELSFRDLFGDCLFSQSNWVVQSSEINLIAKWCRPVYQSGFGHAAG